MWEKGGEGEREKEKGDEREGEGEKLKIGQTADTQLSPHNRGFYKIE